MPTETKTFPSSAPRRKRFVCSLPRLRHDQKGATAVEFGLLAVPFLTFLFVIFEMAAFFIVGQVLDAATMSSARLIRTGQAQEQGFTDALFKASICGQFPMSMLPGCTDNLKVDVRTSPDFRSAELSAVVVDGVLQDDDSFDAGKGNEIVLVRTYYEWPIFMRLMGAPNPTLGNGNMLIVSTVAFRNEPFPDEPPEDES